MGQTKATQERRMRGEERRALILAQAKTVFAQTGYAQASIGDLARASQVTEALLYKHFESKKHLYLTVLQEAQNQMLSSFYERVERRASQDVLDALSNLLMEFRAAALADHEGMQIIVFASVVADDPLVIQIMEAYSAAMSAFVSQLLQKAQAQGLLPAQLDLVAATWGFLSLLIGLGERVRLHLTHQITEQTLREINRLWLHALRTG